MSDAYDFAAKGKLKLKNDSQHKKKKKSKHKHKDKEREKVSLQTSLNESLEEKVTSSAAPKLTKAELAFKQQQEKMRNKRIMEKASTTHKERVEKFNEHLDSLTEHFDIPKVSWTK
ncbi:protein FAM32A-like [Bactrocera neohumeralis]|uniref:protein FAM32A-like n=1 Tax=Bactrocera tryoni TaxID=59916 RepID=UPI001A993D0B|nr:protein FAM32A-like [Bactrocera tryoni]XP_050327852.1 protein FAM32A-like [Bactrocera neohumeralis]